MVQKQTSSTAEKAAAASNGESCNPTAAEVRAILEEGIGPLQEALDERTEWADRMEQEAARRGAVIDELQQALTERTAWAERMVAEAEARGEIISQLQQALAEETARAERLAAEIENRPKVKRKSRGSPIQWLRGTAARAVRARAQRG